jgi:hypothetical protein
MSKVKHRSYRKVLMVENFTVTIAGENIRAKRVLWACVNGVTSRTVKTDHVGFSIYIFSSKKYVITARVSRKEVSINLKKPLESKFFQDINIKRAWDEAFNDASKDFILNNPKYSKNLKGTVSWFNGDQGSITCNITGHEYVVHACNIKGKKTWYSETACVYLKKGEQVTLDICDLGYLSVSVTGGSIHFDQAKWNGLDQSKLAFKCDDEGNATNGFFE